MNEISKIIQCEHALSIFRGRIHDAISDAYPEFAYESMIQKFSKETRKKHKVFPQICFENEQNVSNIKRPDHPDLKRGESHARKRRRNCRRQA